MELVFLNLRTINFLFPIPIPGPDHVIHLKLLIAQVSN